MNERAGLGYDARWKKPKLFGNGEIPVKVTIYDVAREADVSLATVSRVINNSANVKESTRRRVQAAIDRLGFEPNLVASALMTKRTRLIALLVPDISNPFYAEVAWGVEDGAAEMAYNCVICNVGGDTDKQAEYVTVLRRKGIDGIIFGTANHDDELVLELSRGGYPMTLMARDVPAARANRVLVDDGAGGALAARHLLRLGHRRPAMLTEPERIHSSRERARGFEAVFAEAGVRPRMLAADGSDIKAGREIGAHLFSQPDPPTAVFAANDLLALGVMQAARDAGLRIPEDVSIIGFDGTVMADVAQPPLTTIVQPMRDMGQAAVKLLLDSLQEGAPLRKLVMEPQLRIGSTSARPATV